MSDDYNPNSLNAKISQILTNQENEAEERKRLFDRMDDHSKRISSLEKWRTKMAVLVSLAFIGFELAKDKVKEKLFG